MFHTKGMHRITLYPEQAYLEIRVQIYNRTSEPQTFLWWANPAVSVRDEYQSVFPPDVHAVMDHDDQARRCFEQASTGLSEPASAMFYNDQPPDMIFYQGLAHLKLEHNEEALAIFNRLVDYGQGHISDAVKIDYFAVSLPDFLVFDADLHERNHIHCLYMMGLSALGLGNTIAARAHFEAVLTLDASHPGAALHLRMLEDGSVDSN